MNESQILPGLSRRGFLVGTAGIALAAALPASSSLARGKRAAAAAPLAGATVTPYAYGVKDYLQAAKIADGYIGMPLGTTIQKIYFKEGVFGQQPPAKMTQLAAGGCQFLVTIKPSKTRSQHEQQVLAAWLAMMNQSGLTYRVVLWAEFNDMAFTTQNEWLTYWDYYAPVVKAAGVSCGYNPGCNLQAVPRAIAWFPTNPAPDELWMDYYATAFRQGARIDHLIAVAQAAGVPAGLAEWGWFAGVFGPFPMTMPWWNEYSNYLINLAQQRQLGLGSIFYGGLHGTKIDVISSSSDPRIPMIKAVSQAVTA